ncbi:C6 transcription factor [Phialemonium atrogriseum]|uniref:C6 transcription factor n=1 Tax=Phialemonium atrogriseum TaxID=1093897 RepID=A0AAJ0BYQ8_9PEZI|nr:C6 transcription factor [Phialemonium atrogriseum]KAK1765888.1 C6 transcription factor [Phialemonium atrogriseum]
MDDCAMECTSRPLTKRDRAAVACNTCRQTKSKCDSNRPACGRCARQNIECIYSQNVRDKRMERQEERKARWALKNRVNELEAQLAAVSTTTGQTMDSNVTFGGHGPKEKTSPAQMSNGGVSDAGSHSTNTESAIDIIATGAFDQRPAADIGYFGPSSNHALFRSLTHAIANSGHRGALLSHESERQTPINEGPGRTPVPQTSSDLDHHPTTQENQDMLPGPLASIQWITRFSDTVGAVLPYVNESALLREVDTTGARARPDNGRLRSRSVQALLNIVFAHALSTTDAGPAEPFYHRALALLLADEQTVCNSNLETVQALLLLGSFQQNSQRAMASFTSHSLAVKTSYQLGLHSPSSYEGLGTLEKELRAKVWLAVVNQDRILSAALGRPCLIPLQHVRTEIADSLVLMHHTRTVTMPSSMENLVCFRHLISLHEIMGISIDSIYGCNIGSPSDLAPGDLIAKTIELLSRLGQWRDGISPFGILSQKSDLNTWCASKFHTERYMLLLSIYYYKTVMLASGPVLIAVLERAVDPAADGAAVGILQDASASVLKSDLQALKEFQRIIRGILQHDRPFFKRNAVWWVCNFTAFTMCLHLFALWMTSILSATMPSALGLTSSEAESLLLEGLETLKSIGGSSIMSFKAHRCLTRYIQLSRVIASNTRRQNSIAGSVGSEIFHDLQQSLLPNESFLRDSFPDFTMTSVDDLFCQLGDNDFLSAGGFGVEHQINNLDVGGFMYQ